MSDSGQKGAVVTLVELEEEGETNSWRGVSQEVMFLKILDIGMSKHLADSIDARWSWRRWEPWKQSGNVRFLMRWTGSSSFRQSRASPLPYYSCTWIFHANSQIEIVLEESPKVIVQPLIWYCEVFPCRGGEFLWSKQAYCKFPELLEVWPSCLCDSTKLQRALGCGFENES